MLIKHEKATPRIEKGRVELNTCLTQFETEQGTKGTLYVQRWVNNLDVETNKSSRAELRYVASLNLNRPGTNTWCGAIDIPTTDLGKILPWITTTADQCNSQLKLEDKQIIEVALTDLARQFSEFLPTLQSEDFEIKECFAKLPATV